MMMSMSMKSQEEIKVNKKDNNYLKLVLKIFQVLSILMMKILLGFNL